MHVALKILIDECLSPELALIARNEFQVQATHVPWLGKPPHGHASWKDPDIVERIAAEDFTLVTNNRRDFVGSYYRQGGLELHNGLIIICMDGPI